MEDPIANAVGAIFMLAVFGAVIYFTGPFLYALAWCGVHSPAPSLHIVWACAQAAP
jgi:hypothetical protein